MGFDDAALERINSAFQEYKAERERLGKPLPDAIPEMTSADIKKVAERLTTPSDKMVMAFMFYTVMPEEKKEDFLRWGRELVQGKNGLSTSLLAIDGIFYTGAAGFAAKISPDEYKRFIKSSLIAYASNIDLLKMAGLDTSYQPTVDDLEHEINTLDPKDYTGDMLGIGLSKPLQEKLLRGIAPNRLHLRMLDNIADPAFQEILLTRMDRGNLIAGELIYIKDTALRHKFIAGLEPSQLQSGMMDHVTDPALLKKIAAEVATTEDAESLLHPANIKKLSAVPGGADILKKAFGKVTGIDVNNPSQSQPGILVGLEKLSEYAKALKIEDAVGKHILSITPTNPSLGMEYAAQHYPKDPSALAIYQAALPSANKLLDDPKTAALVVQMLNVLEPSQYAGQAVRLVPEKDVFRLLDGASATQLYDVITQQQSSESFAYTQGTYNEIARRFYERLKIEGKSLEDVASSSLERTGNIRKFIETADVYHRMGEMVKSTTENDHHYLVGLLFTREDNMGYNISLISSLIKSLPKGHPAVALIESTIIDTAIKGNDYVKADMGVLSHWYANQTTHTPLPEHRAFFDKVKNDPTFEIPPLKSIPANNMLDAAGRNFQLHVFYNDKDGIDTYKSFSASLKADGWTQKKQDDFLIFSKERNGRRIEILVSPPESNGKAVEHIQAYVTGKNGVISVLSGRGHAHHMAEAVELITPATKLVALGGCWGHQYASNVLDKSPDAHILATTGVGRMGINNINTRWINEQILSGRDVDWTGLQGEWNKLKGNKAFAADIANYISPNENIMLLYIKKINELYSEIEQRESGTKPTSQLQDQFMISVRALSSTTNTSQPASATDPALRALTRS